MDYDSEVTVTREQAIEAIIKEQEDSGDEFGQNYHQLDDGSSSSELMEDSSWIETEDSSKADPEEGTEPKVKMVVIEETFGIQGLSSADTDEEHTAIPDDIEEDRENTILCGVKKIQDALKNEKGCRKLFNMTRREARHLTENGLKRKLSKMSAKELKEVTETLEKTDSRAKFQRDLDEVERLGMPEKGEYIMSASVAILAFVTYAIMACFFFQQMYEKPETIDVSTLNSAE